MLARVLPLLFRTLLLVASSATGFTEHNRERAGRGALAHALRLGLLASFVVLAMGACGGGSGGGGGAQQGPQAHALPKQGKPLAPGEYQTKVFEPGMSFSVGKGWMAALPETRDAVALFEQNGPTLIGILNVQKVYDPSHPEEPLKPAPEDMLSWLQEHPRLEVEPPSRVSVGGVSGQQFDAIASEPKKGPEFCSEPCVPLFYITNNNNFWVGKSEKYRFIVLGDVKGQEVTILFGGPAVEFDESVPKAQKVLDTIKWEGA